jgi:hypothetical protein
MAAITFFVFEFAGACFFEHGRTERRRAALFFTRACLFSFISRVENAIDVS